MYILAPAAASIALRTIFLYTGQQTLRERESYMVAAVRHGMSQVGQQVVCVLAPAAVSIALRIFVPRSILSSTPISYGLFGMTVCASTMYAYRQPGWAWKTTLVASFFLTALTGMIAARPQPRPSLNEFHPEDDTIDFRNASPVFAQGWQLSQDATLNFVEMTQHGQKWLIPVRITDKNSQRSTTLCTDASPISIYLSILAQEQEPLNPMSIKTFLSYWNIEAEKDFLAYISSTRSDWNLPILSFSPSRACEALQLARRHDMNIHTSLLYTPARQTDDRVTQEQNLFTAWVGKGHVKLIRTMLELDSRLITQLPRGDTSPIFVVGTQIANLPAQLSLEQRLRLEEACILIRAIEQAIDTSAISLSNDERGVVPVILQKAQLEGIAT